MRELFLNEMSQRSASILREDIQSLGPTKLRDVEDAQSMIANMAKELASRGEIVIGIGGDERFIE
jgi:flagellar motor switch protein FliG